MKFRDLEDGCFVLYKTQTNVWLSRVFYIDLVEETIRFEDLWNQNSVSKESSPPNYNTLEEIDDWGWKIIKVYDEKPKEFLI